MRQLAIKPTDQITIDPQRFQFRTVAHHDTMKAVTTWNADLAGTLAVWVDPVDQRIYVIDGHHRVALARRLAVPELAVRFMAAKTAKEARLVGALINIAGGRASAIDAAKVIRDSQLNPTDYGLPPGGAILRDGMKLAGLAPELFTMAATGDLELPMALALSAAGCHANQRGLWRIAARQRWSAAATAEAAQLQDLATVRSETSGSIPGLIELVQTSDFSEVLAIRAAIRRRLKGEIRALGAAARSRDSAILSAAGNRIDRDRSSAARAQAAAVEATFSRLINTRGPLAELVKLLAAEVTASRTALAVVDENLDLLRDAIRAEL